MDTDKATCRYVYALIAEDGRQIWRYLGIALRDALRDGEWRIILAVLPAPLDTTRVVCVALHDEADRDGLVQS